MPGIDDYTKLLLHLDNNATDASSYGNNGSEFGTYSNATKKWGYSAQLDTGTPFTSISNPLTFDFSTSNFVIDWWHYNVDDDPLGAPGKYFWQFKKFGGFDCIIFLSVYGATSNMRALWFDSTNGFIDEGISVDRVPHGAWTHVAFIRSGGTMYIAYNGVIRHSDSFSNISAPSGTMKMIMGSASTNGVDISSTNTDHFVDEFRISIGTDRGWTSDFTPPDEPYSSAVNNIVQMIITNV